MTRPQVALAAALGLILAMPSLADPRLDEKVYDPYIENHVLEFEARAGQEIGGALDGERTVVMEAEYGLDDRLSLAVVAPITRTPGQESRLSHLGVEAVVYLGVIPRTGIDTGLYLEYAKGLDGQTDAAEAKLLLARTSGRFQGLVNIIAERPLGAPAGQGFASYGYAASAMWRTVGNLRLGAQTFGDLGDDHGVLSRAQGAYVGPEVKWSIRPRSSPFEIKLDASWLRAVGPDRREASSQARLGIELERGF
jgi:hypothetical protein